MKLSIEFILSVLLEYGVINEEVYALFNAKKGQYFVLFQNRYKKDPFPTELFLFIATEEGLQIEEDSILKIIAGRAGCDVITIDPLKIDTSLVVSTISLPYGFRNKILPLGMKGNYILLAMADPFRNDLLEQLKLTSGKPILPILASVRDVEKVLVDLFGFKKSISAAAKDYGTKQINDIEQLRVLTDVTGMDDTHIITAVDYMLKYGIDQGASDIHIEPKRNETYIRFRIDGILHTIYNFPSAVHLPFVSRLKMLAAMDIAEKRRPQDGRIKVQIESGAEVEIRTSTVPVVHGEKVVLRILETGNSLKPLEEIGFVENQLEEWMNSMQKGFGMVLVTGPTGSGKSTTLYSTLKRLASSEINIITVEDPIEIVVEEVNQIALNRRAGITFGKALRHILRQDPDIIMVGEIRDTETAENAVQAALTGHLVLSTIHTNDTSGSVQRFLDLGIEPFIIGSVLNGIIAQRLVRKNCPYCIEERPMTEREKITLGLPVGKDYMIHESEGCPKCRYTGYKGRTAIVEFMPVTQRMRELISKGATSEELRDNAVMDGMITMRESAIRKLAEGVTSFSEILKALFYN